MNLRSFNLFLQHGKFPYHIFNVLYESEITRKIIRRRKETNKIYEFDIVRNVNIFQYLHIYEFYLKSIIETHGLYKCGHL